MPKLTFYHQKRFDGGERTGVELGLDPDDSQVVGDTVLEQFRPGPGDRDPALLWFVDVRCEGLMIPGDGDAAVRWLLSTRDVMDGGFTRFADHLRRAGSDLDDYPLRWGDFPIAGDGVDRSISCSAARRVDARGLAQILDDLRATWVGRIEEMMAGRVDYASRD